MKPFVGIRAAELDTTCAFTPDLDTAKCDRRATQHMLSDAPGWGIVSLASCAAHASIARLSAPVMLEHDFGDLCASNECWYA